jgi:hypothetical protein
VKWNLRWAAAKRDIWRPSDLLAAFEQVGFRLHDPGWITNPVGGRSSQLMLILPGDRLPKSQPLHRPSSTRSALSG